MRAGLAPSATDNGNGTATDNTTGLMWEKKDDAGGIHDWDNSYTWGQLEPQYPMNGTMVTEFLAALNTPPCFAGHCDWRIPNVRELHSLVHYGVANPATGSAFHNRDCAAGCTVDGIGGPRCSSCTQSSFYWSSTTYQEVLYTAWGVYFGDGRVLPFVKSTGYYVRAVRGGL